MTADRSSIQLSGEAESWDEIENLVHEIALLARASTSSEAFYSGLLDRSMEALAAIGGAIWKRDSAGRISLCHQLNLNRTNLLDDSDSASTRHEKLLVRVLEQKRSEAFHPDSESTDGVEAYGNPTEYLILAAPILDEENAIGVIEVFQRTGTSPAAVSGYLRFMNALSELAAEHHRNCQLRQFKDQAAGWEQFQKFTHSVHASLDLNTTAYTIANDGRSIIGCDRLAVGILVGRRIRIRAISGVDVIDSRSNAIRGLEGLADCVVASGSMLWLDDSTDENREHLASLDEVRDYLAESSARFLAVVPLRSIEPSRDVKPSQPANSNSVIGVLIIECFQSDFDTEVIRRQFNLLYRQSELALSNTIEHNRLPVVPGMRMLLSRQRRGLWSKTVWIVLLLISLTLTLFLVPADFTIEGRGELQPLARRDVFAIRDGIVPNLDPEVWSTSRSVFQGDELLKLNNSDLDYKITLVEGEKLTAQERLSTVQADRLGKNPITAEEQERDNRLAAEERELIERLSNLEKQNAILIKQFAELTLKSPISGSVVTTEIVRKLEMRPVRRGELLMSVADLQGAWVLEIKVPDHRIGHIRDARRELKSDLDVAFVLATDPSKTHHGTVDSVALSTELHDSDGPTVLVTVTFDRNQISELRPGASVIPRIHCGRRSLGYVWLHELFESIEKKLWAW